MAQWWKNPTTLTDDELEAKIAECVERSNAHKSEDRPILADAALSKAIIAEDELQRRSKNS